MARLGRREDENASPIEMPGLRALHDMETEMTKPLSHERLEAEEHWCEYITNMKNHPDWKPFDNNFIDKSLKDMMRFAYISGFLTGRKHGIAYPHRLEGGEG